MSESCHYCGATEKELRPYGPGGSRVCFSCAMATPEREAATGAAFGALLDGTAAIADVIQIGTSDGPVPFDPNLAGLAPDEKNGDKHELAR